MNNYIGFLKKDILGIIDAEKDQFAGLSTKMG